MKTDRVIENNKTKMELGEIMEIYLIHHQVKDGTFHKVILSADRKLYNRETRHLDNQTVIQPLVPLLKNKKFRKVTINLQRTWSASPTLMIALTNSQNFVL